jgi:hypothetical protein
MDILINAPLLLADSGINVVIPHFTAVIEIMKKPTI